MAIQIDFSVRCGVQDVRADSTNEKILGVWKPKPTYVANEKAKSLLVNLANTPQNVQAILGFTKRYGPLFGVFEAGKEFNPVGVDEWIKFQNYIRNQWKKYGRAAAPKHWPKRDQSETDQPALPPLPRVLLERRIAAWPDFLPQRDMNLLAFDDHLDFLIRNPQVAGGLIGAANTIGYLVELIQFGQDPRTFRLCWNKECVHPYFIATDLRAHYCSTECLDRGTAQQKLEWWKERGPEWRSKRKRKRESDVDA